MDLIKLCVLLVAALCILIHPTLSQYSSSYGWGSAGKGVGKRSRDNNSQFLPYNLQNSMCKGLQADIEKAIKSIIQAEGRRQRLCETSSSLTSSSNMDDLPAKRR